MKEEEEEEVLLLLLMVLLTGGLLFRHRHRAPLLCHGFCKSAALEYFKTHVTRRIFRLFTFSPSEFLRDGYFDRYAAAAELLFILSS